LCHIKNSC